MNRSAAHQIARLAKTPPVSPAEYVHCRGRLTGVASPVRLVLQIEHQSGQILADDGLDNPSGFRKSKWIASSGKFLVRLQAEMLVAQTSGLGVLVNALAWLEDRHGNLATIPRPFDDEPDNIGHRHQFGEGGGWERWYYAAVIDSPGEDTPFEFFFHVLNYFDNSESFHWTFLAPGFITAQITPIPTP